MRDISLVSLFEQNQQSIKEQLSSIILPRDEQKLKDTIKHFFWKGAAISEFKNSLNDDELTLLHSCLKLVTSTPNIYSEQHSTSVAPVSNEEPHENKTRKWSPIIGTAVGAGVGSIIFSSFGGFLGALLGCLVGMHLKSKDTKEYSSSSSHTGQEFYIDVNEFVSSLKNACECIDSIFKIYRTDIHRASEANQTPKHTLSRSYKPLLNSLATLHAKVDFDNLSEDNKVILDNVFRALSNQYYDLVHYSEENKHYFNEIPSEHVSEVIELSSAILEEDELIQKGECLVPINKNNQ